VNFIKNDEGKVSLTVGAELQPKKKISADNGSLQKYYFPIHPACRYLPEQEKNSIINNIKTSLPTQKISMILQENPKIMDLVNHIFELQVKNSISYTLPINLRYLLLLVTCFLNFLYVTSNQVNVVNTERTFGWVYSEIKLIYEIMGCVHFTICFAIVVAQGYVRTRVILTNSNYQTLKDYHTDLDKLSINFDDHHQYILSLCRQSPRETKLRHWVEILTHYQEKVEQVPRSVFPKLQIVALRATQLVKDMDLVITFMMFNASYCAYIAGAGNLIYSLF
jgi:hypothetical protein